MRHRRSIGSSILPAPALRGFSVLEVVFVIAIVGTLLALALPAAGALASVRTDMARERVATLLRYAHTVAIAKERSTWVRFDRAADRVDAFVEDPTDPGATGRDPLPDPLNGGPLVLDVAAAGADLELVSFGGSFEVEFDRRGTPRNAIGVPLSAVGSVRISGLLVEVVDGTGLVRIP